MLLEGLQIAHYRCLQLLESGGMSEVYLAEDLRIYRQVALKILHPEITPSTDIEAVYEAFRLFHMEAQAISALDHPNILPLYDYGETTINGVKLAYMVMPYRHEGSLAAWVKQRSRTGRLTLQEVAHFLRQAADALQYAHEHNLIHRDVKPSNFLIFNSKKNQRLPDLQLADFGVAKFMNAISTPSHTIRGTPFYMAPEQWKGAAVFATDQYALAIMVYELLTGRPPFQGENQEQILYKHIYVPPQPPSTFNPRIPTEVDIVIMRALLKNPRDRYASISDFARAFQHALTNGRNIHVTLTINASEARYGVRRLITLPGGQRVSIDVPKGAYDGQVIRVEGLGIQTRHGGPVGVLIITITITQTEEIALLPTMLPRTAPAFNNEIAPAQQKRSHFSIGKFLIITLAFLLVFAGLAFIISSTINQQSSATKSGADVTATQRARMFISQSATANAITQTAGHNFNATATSRAELSATASAQMTATVSSQDTATSIARGATATAIADLTATVTAYNAVIMTGPPVLNDALRDNTQGNNWDTAAQEGSGCAFANGVYHSTILQPGFFSPCFAQNPSFSNFSYQVQMKIVKGDQGGICFRANTNNGAYYAFYINSNGTYDLETYNNGISTGILRKGSSSAIKTGLNQTNLIAVVANGNQIDLYVNMQLIDSVTDSMYSSGQIGVVAEDINNPTDVAFNNAQVWTM